MDELPWWEIFGDPVLVALVEEALGNSRDLAAAAARVEQARFFVGVARADLFPQIGYGAEAGRGRTSESVGGTGETADFFLGALDLAWEIDIWGRIRRATEAARAELLATEAFERGVRLSLVSDVAQAYFELRELDLELEIAHRSAESFERRATCSSASSRAAPPRASRSSGPRRPSPRPRLRSPRSRARSWPRRTRSRVLLGRTPGDDPARRARSPSRPSRPRCPPVCRRRSSSGGPT